jgi:RNase P subunit RPR2
MKLNSKYLSYCCKAPQMIVQSRSGGFVSQNCEKCGKSSYISQNELPDLFCKKCSVPLVTGLNIQKNYIYRCPICDREFLVWDLVPNWKEYFEEYGLGLGSDFYEDGRKKY